MQRTFQYILMAIGLQLGVGASPAHAQCVNGGTPGPNLIVNGDFSAGNVSFTSDYIYCNTNNCLQPEGTYAVGPDASFFHSGFTGFDHTTGTGNFMIVNGSVNSGYKVWRQSVAVAQNMDYQFDFWVQSCVASNPAQLIVQINGSTVHSGTLNAPNTTNLWVQHQLPWNSGSATTADIVIINQNLAPSGNDFGLDDLAFYTCQMCTLPVQTIPDTTICRYDTIQLTTTAPSGVNYSWSPTSWLSNPYVASPLAFPLSSTHYTVTVTDPTGCIGYDTVFVQVAPNPSVTNPGNQIICEGDSVQLVTNYGGNPSLSWSPAGSLSCSNCPNPIAFPTSNTTYTYTATGAAGCQTIGTTTVNISSTPSVDAGNDLFLCNNQSGQLNGSYSDTAMMQGLQWTPAAGLTPSTVFNPFANPANTTTYTLAVTNVHGCTGYDSVTVHRSSVLVDAGPDRQVCTGETVQLQASLTGGVASFSWSPASGLSNPNTLTPSFTPSGTTTLTLQVTDTNGCTAADQVTVSVDPQPIIQVTPDTNLCTGSSITLGATGASVYQWSPSTGLSCSTCANPVANPAQTQTYTVIGTDGNGCKDTAQTAITIRPKPVITVSASDSICVGQTTVLTASGTGTFAWKPTGTLSCTNCPNPTASPVLTTTYTVVATSPFGCKDSASTTIHVASGPPLTISPDATICPGDSVQLQVSGANSYAWSPSGSLSCANCPNPTAKPNATTTYTVIGNSSLGCGSVDTVRITVRAPGKATVSGDTVICSGGSKSWQAAGLQSYQWSPASGLTCTTCPTPQVSPTSTTTYTLSGLDQNGCSALPVTRTMHIRGLPNIQITGPDTLCQGAIGQLSAQGGQSYNWSPTTNLSCNTCPNPSLILNQSRTYQVVGTDGFGCQNTDTLRITVIPQPVVTTSPDGAICEGESYPITATGGGSYQWQGAGLSCSACPNPLATPLQTTTYTLTVTNATGCKTIDSVSISVNAKPTLTVSNDGGVCAGETFNLTASGAISYQWAPGGSLSCTNCPNPLVNPTVTTMYTVTGTSAANCTATDSVQVEVYALPQIQITPDTGICRGNSIQLQSSGGTQYSWSPMGTLSDPSIANPVATPGAATTYTVEVTDGNGCKATNTVMVAVNDPLAAQARPDTIICNGEAVQLTAQNGQSFQWTPPNGLDDPSSATPIATPGNTMTYYLTMTDINGCTTQDSVFIEVLPAPNADAGPDVTIYQGQPITLSGSGGLAYLWRPGDGMNDSTTANPILRLNDTTTFTLYVTDANGCTASDQVTIFVLPLPSLHMPSAFTPNGDGHNDLFMIPYGVDIEITRFVVFDRWGVQVFDTNNPQRGWDGTMGGEIQPIGTYVYILEGFHSDGSPIHKMGNVTLIR